MKERMLRGGMYGNVTWDLRLTDRFGCEPEDRFWDTGFRVVVKRRKR